MLEMLNRKRTVQKPWGCEVIWAETPDYVGKLLYINEEIENVKDNPLPNNNEI